MDIAAEWTNDCFDVTNFDGMILSIARYNRSYGYTCYLLFRFFDEAKSHLPDGNVAILDEKEFEGEINDKIRQQTDEWAQERFDEIVALLRTRFELEPQQLGHQWPEEEEGMNIDGKILSLDSRCHPRGGGYLILEDGKPPEGAEERPEIKPSAYSSILFHHGDEETITLAEEEFEGEIQTEVQKQASEWAQAQFEKFVALLKTRYNIDPQNQE